MHIEKIILHNVMGIAHLEFAAGKFNVARGKNGAGKTSILEAIKSVVKGGKDATLIRKGEKAGQIVLILDDGTTISQTMTNESVQPLVIKNNGVKVATPATVMKALADIVSVNPIEFIRCDKKNRIDVLLDSMPIEIDMEALGAIVGHKVTRTAQAPFDQIETLREEVFCERTATNRVLREKKAAIEQLSQTLPVEDSATGNEDHAGLLAEMTALDAARDAEVARIEVKLGRFRTNLGIAQSEIRVDADKEIAAWQEQIANARTTRDAALADEQATFNGMEALANAQRATTAEAHAARRGAFAGRLEAIKANVQTAARTAQTRENIATMTANAAALESDAKQQSAALDQIDAYKSELLATLPVTGLEVRGNEIYRHGIVFDRLNTGQQIGIAVEIAKLRAGPLNIICVDGIEVLDDAHFVEFQEQVVAAGLQAFVTQVDNCELELTAQA